MADFMVLYPDLWLTLENDEEEAESGLSLFLVLVPSLKFFSSYLEIILYKKFKANLYNSCSELTSDDESQGFAPFFGKSGFVSLNVFIIELTALSIKYI